MFFVVFQKIFLDTILQTLYFPVWWYSGGLKYAATACFGFFRAGNSQLMPGLWLKNIFVPMYGQYDIQGRIISFLMRFVQVIARSIALLFWLCVCLSLFCVWLALPIIIAFGMYRSIL